MQKKKLIGKRVALAKAVCTFNKGQTGKITAIGGTMTIFVKFDGDERGCQEYKEKGFPIFLDELYFQDNIDGYNQKCFQNP